MLEIGQDSAGAVPAPGSYWQDRPAWSRPQAQQQELWLRQPVRHGEQGRLRWCAPPAGMQLWLSLHEPQEACPGGPPALLGLPSLAALSPLFAVANPLVTPEWLPSLLELALAPMLSLLGGALGRSLTVGLAQEAPVDARGQALAGTGLLFTPSDGSAPLHARLMPAAAWSPPALPVPGGAGLVAGVLQVWGGLPHGVSLLLDRGLWRASELQQLQPGDVLRLHQPPSWPLSRVWLSGPGAQVLGLARLDGDSLTMVVAMTDSVEVGRANVPMPSDGEQGSELEGAPLALLDLPVQLSFELGRLELPLSRLAELREGSVLPLGQRVAEHLVTVRANGVLVGRAELVRLGEEVALQLLQWKAPRP